MRRAAIPHLSSGAWSSGSRRLARQELEVQRLRRQHTSTSIRVPASIGTLPPCAKQRVRRAMTDPTATSGTSVKCHAPIAVPAGLGALRDDDVCAGLKRLRSVAGASGIDRTAALPHPYRGCERARVAGGDSAPPAVEGAGGIERTPPLNPPGDRVPARPEASRTTYKCSQESIADG